VKRITELAQVKQSVTYLWYILHWCWNKKQHSDNIMHCYSAAFNQFCLLGSSV